MIHTSEIDGTIKLTPSKVLPMIKKWKRLLKLEHWTVGLSVVEAAKEHDMEISMTPTRQYAAIRVHPRSWGYSKKKFERLIVHELLHILFDPIEREHERALLTSAMYPHNIVHEKVETTLDHIANVIYDLK